MRITPNIPVVSNIPIVPYIPVVPNIPIVPHIPVVPNIPVENKLSCLANIRSGDFDNICNSQMIHPNLPQTELNNKTPESCSQSSLKQKSHFCGSR